MLYYKRGILYKFYTIILPFFFTYLISLLLIFYSLFNFIPLNDFYRFIF